MSASGRSPFASRRALVLLGLFAGLAAGLPFLGKAFHIDDVHFLTVAEQILRAPLDPFGVDIHWTDDPEPIFKTWNPPFLSYWLAPWVAAFGRSERALHVAVLPFLALYGAAAGALAHRFARGSPWAVLFAILGPAVIPSGNVMLDVPAAALAAAGFALVVEGTDRRRRRLVLLGGILAAFAILTKYSAAAVLPVVSGYPLLRGRPGDAARALVPAIMLIALWSAQNLIVYGEAHVARLFARRAAESWIRPTGERAWNLVAIAGASLFLGMPVGWMDVAKRRRVLFAGSVAAALLAVSAARAWFGLEAGAPYLVAVALGGALLFRAFAEGIHRGPNRSDRALLLVWAAAPLAAAVFLVPFQAVRHFVPAILPITLLLAGVIDGAPRRFAALAGTFLALQAITGFGVGSADAEYAATYRDFARDELPRVALGGGETWFVGHWGWQHYAEAAGATPVTTHGRAPAAGDIVVVPERVHKGNPPAGLMGRVRLVETKSYEARNPLRTTLGPGDTFYCLTGAHLPYRRAPHKPLEIFRVYRVVR